MSEHPSLRATPDQWALRWLKTLPHSEPGTRVAFSQWIRQSPRHVEAHLRQTMLQTELKGLDPNHRIDVDVLIEKARRHLQQQENIINFPECGDDERQSDSCPPEKRRLWTKMCRIGLIAIFTAMGHRLGF